MNAQIQVAPSRLLFQNGADSFLVGVNGSRRGRLEILAEILLFCRKEENKTRIMYANNLNYDQLQNHLRFLNSRRLLTSENGKYVTTEKGFAFLKLFIGIHNLLSE